VQDNCKWDYYDKLCNQYAIGSELLDIAFASGLGPEHDWSRNAADAFGLMAISYEEPSRHFNRKLVYQTNWIV
jgi:hypothetical protein